MHPMEWTLRQNLSMMSYSRGAFPIRRVCEDLRPVQKDKKKKSTSRGALQQVWLSDCNAFTSGFLILARVYKLRKHLHPAFHRLVANAASRRCFESEIISHPPIAIITRTGPDRRHFFRNFFEHLFP